MTVKKLNIFLAVCLTLLVSLFHQNLVSAFQTSSPTSNTLLTLQVNSSSDDVNQDGTFYDPASSTVWIGNGSSTTSSYTGLRFNNVTIPKGATITSAIITVYNPGSSWINTSLTISAEAIGNSPTFSSTNTPSQRKLTTSQISWTDNSQWLANTSYQLSDISPVIQEIINRSDWNSGNSLSIIMKGIGSSWGRKYVSSFDGSPTNAPQLVISYITSGMTPTPTVTPTSIPPTPTPTPTITYTDAQFTKSIITNAHAFLQESTTSANFSPVIPKGEILSTGSNVYPNEVGYLQQIKNSNNPAVKDYYLEFGSVATASADLTPTNVQTLKNIGVSTLLYNPESGHTPASEYNARFNADSSNPIIQFGNLAQSLGFNAIWAPTRFDADATSDQTISLIYSSGINGVVLQDQKQLNNACYPTQIITDTSTINRHNTDAGRSISVIVQLMSTWCDTADTYSVNFCNLNQNHYRWQACDAFTAAENNSITDLAIWASAPTDLQQLGTFVDTIRLVESSPTSGQ